jgi:alanine racemase
MTLRLTIDERAWRTHVDTVRAATPGLVPVVKGNGYGFGRPVLATVAATLSDEMAVGTVHELAEVAQATADRPPGSIVALTPAMHLPTELPRRSVPTVSTRAHVDVPGRHSFRGRVAVKLESSMHRHGAQPETLGDLLDAVGSAGLEVHQFVLHLPLSSPAFTSSLAVEQVEGWLTHLDPDVPLSISHVTSECFEQLRARHPARTFRLRAGTALWHGDKSFLHLSADVLDVRRISIGTPVGYRQVPAAASGHLVMIGAGSAHGVVPLEHALSPFHHARQRLSLVEPPHMHTSMVLVTDEGGVPAMGDWVDVQRPLISVSVDALEWR